MVQLCIGRSADGALHLYAKEIPPPPDPDAPRPDPDASPAESTSSDRNSTPTTPSYILKLPDELLEACFRPLIEADLDIPYSRDWRFQRFSCRGCRRHVTARRLHRVCQRFATIVHPLLYSDIALFAGAIGLCQTKDEQNRHTQLFLRTVAQQPHVVRHLRSLDAPVDVFAQLLQCQPETVLPHLHETLQVLDLGGWTVMPRAREQWDGFVEVLRTLRGLTTLRVINLPEGYQTFAAIVPVLQLLPGLVRIDLGGIECPQPPRFELSNWPIPNHAETLQERLDDEAAALPPPDSARTSRLKELHLANCSRMSPAALQNFLLWSRSLEVFTLDMMGIGGYNLQSLIDMGMLSYPWTWHLLRAALQPHAATLRELRVEQMATQEGLDTFSLHDFPALHTFETAFCGPPATGEAAAALWLTPSLTVLVLDCAGHDSQCGKIYSFGQREQDWCVALAACAAAKPCGLRRIEILYELDESEWAPHEYAGQTLRCMFATKEAVEKLGIRFVLPEFSEEAVVRHNLPRTR